MPYRVCSATRAVTGPLPSGSREREHHAVRPIRMTPPGPHHPSPHHAPASTHHLLGGPLTAILSHARAVVHEPAIGRTHAAAQVERVLRLRLKGLRWREGECAPIGGPDPRARDDGTVHVAVVQRDILLHAGAHGVAERDDDRRAGVDAYGAP